MKLRNLRLEENLTHKQLASIIGCTSETISRWERGVAWPQLSNIQKLQDYFGKDNISRHDFGVYL